MSPSSPAPRPLSLAYNQNLRAALLFVAVGGLYALSHRYHPYYQAGLWAALGLAVALGELAKHRQRPQALYLKGLGWALLLTAAALLGQQVRHDRAESQARRVAASAR